MMEKNPPLKSKINVIGLAISMIGLASAYDLIPVEAEEHLIEATLIVGGPLIMTFRTWFN